MKNDTLSMPNHSPLPWIAAPGYSLILGDVQDDAGEPIVQVYDSETGSKQGNAQYIVRAVNNHQALVDALEKAISYIASVESECAESLGIYDGEPSDDLHALQTLLEQVKQ